MYCVPQPKRDDRRRQYDLPSDRQPKMLSPEINEVLHMLKAIEEQSDSRIKN